ncbi:MAG TPA: ankyrin repeat domain-containing protein [Armatimonadota bacterium]|nr:ankyrin repeat domain-containing protein [Armatimonadota bacterium]
MSEEEFTLSGAQRDTPTVNVPPTPHATVPTPRLRRIIIIGLLIVAIPILIYTTYYVVNYQEIKTVKFITAARDGDLSLVVHLLKNGVKINDGRPLKGMTALMTAAGNGQYAVAEYLLQHGANVNQQCDTGATALVFAVIDGKPDMVSLLLSYGANPAIRDRTGFSALDTAKLFKNDKIINQLEHQKKSIP